MKPQLETPTQAWAGIQAAARTPEQHACLDVARATFRGDLSEDVWSLQAAETYWHLLTLGTYAGLNRQPATAAHAADLYMIIEADGSAVPARWIDGQTRALFLRREWVTSLDRDGKPAAASDWTATLRATLAGRAVAAAALSNPIELTDAQAAALLTIERAGQDGFSGHFPGQPGARRVAVRFGLLVERQGNRHAPPDWFLLTPAGVDALARWRARPRRRVLPTKTQALLLGRLVDGNPDPVMEATVGTYEVCEQQQWIRYGQATATGRRRPIITAAGREAYQAYQARVAKPGRAAPKRVFVGEIEAGQRVRLANRRGYLGMDASWVTVTRMEHIPRAGNRPGGWRVWIRRGEREALYAEAPFNPKTRFEVNES